MFHSNRQTGKRTITGRRIPPSAIAAAVGALALAVVSIVWFSSRRRGEPAEAFAPNQVVSPPLSGARDVADSPETREASALDISTAPRPSAADDADAAVMWESPTSGAPLDLSYLVSGAQLVLSWRPREFLAQDEGKLVLDVLGRYGELARQRLPALAGTPLSNMDQVLLGVSPGEGGRLGVAMVVRTHDWVDEAELLRAWDEPPIESVEGGRLARGTDYAYFLPDNENAQRIVVVVPLDRVDELLAAAGGAPPLRRDLETLLATSDAERHLSVLVVPYFLQSAGQALLTDELEPLSGPLDAFFADEVQAALVSLHLNENLFVELRAVAGAEHNPFEFVETMRRRVEAARSTAQSWPVSKQDGDGALQLLERWPRMIEHLVRYTQFDLDGRQVILRAYLPRRAAHNLILATLLALGQRSDNTGVGAVSATAAIEELAVGERLERKITLRFNRGTLEGALTSLGELIDVRIIVLGGDLQLEGITKNQSFGLDEQEVSARDVLNKILRLASPEGKLVYTVKPAALQDDAGEVIHITTLKAATQRGDRLPAELQPAPEVRATSDP